MNYQWIYYHSNIQKKKLLWSLVGSVSTTWYLWFPDRVLPPASSPDPHNPIITKPCHKTLAKPHSHLNSFTFSKLWPLKGLFWCSFSNAFFCLQTKCLVFDDLIIHAIKINKNCKILLIISNIFCVHRIVEFLKCYIWKSPPPCDMTR